MWPQKFLSDILIWRSWNLEKIMREKVVRLWIAIWGLRSACTLCSGVLRTIFQAPFILEHSNLAKSITRPYLKNWIAKPSLNTQTIVHAHYILACSGESMRFYNARTYKQTWYGTLCLTSVKYKAQPPKTSKETKTHNTLLTRGIQTLKTST